MELKGEYRIASDRQTVWAALNDPDVLKKCIPGCESLEKQDDDSFQGRIAAAIGPVRARFETVIRREDPVPPERYTLTGEAKSGATGFGRGSADVRLSEQDGGTLLSYTADFKVGGKLAQVGSRLVLGAARKTADDFFGCFSRELDSGATRVDAAASESAPGPEKSGPGKTGSGKSWLAAAAVVVVLLIVWILLV